MVLKVLHPYLDECNVAFVAVANKSFDAANANRMICIYRSLPSQSDQLVLAYGCLGLSTNRTPSTSLDAIIRGLCEGYRRVLSSPDVPKLFHDRDFIYMLRELRFQLPQNTAADDQEMQVDAIKPIDLLRALENNFNGIEREQFQTLVNLFFEAVQVRSPHFRLSTDQRTYRDVPTILRESMKLDPRRRRLYGRYKLVIDESEDDSAIHLLLQTGILDSDLTRTTILRMSDFVDDVNNELSNVEMLSTIKLCMETGKTILMVNTGRIHGSLYDVFNQNFSIMATGDARKIFSKVAIGPKTIDVMVHEDFQCIVHLKRSELRDIPPPFLSRFQKYSLSINDFYRIRLQQLPHNEQLILQHVETQAQSFIQHFGRQYFYGLNESTLPSCLLPLIERNGNDEYALIKVHQHYTQFTIRYKSFLEQNPSDLSHPLLRRVLAKLVQLVSPESIILKLPTLDTKVEQWLSNLYFQQQEHFSLENFLRQFAFDTSEETEMISQPTTKVMIFTRTSSYVLGLNQRSKHDFSDDEQNYRNVEILNLGTVENSTELEEKFETFTSDRQKNIFLVVIDARLGQKRLHIPFVRQLIDKTDYACNAANPHERKYFLMLIHSPAQDLYHQSSFPSIFLHHWDFYFFDTCAAGSAFYLQNMIKLLSSSSPSSADHQETVLCDLNVLFEDCLWDFCSRLQMILPVSSPEMFTNPLAHQFYQAQTSTMRRVHCLRQILQGLSELQHRIVTIYHEHLSATNNSSKKISDFIYQISKEILCGKRFDGLVDSIQSQTRQSFTSFVCTVFKIIVNDYGLDTLPQLSIKNASNEALFSLIDFQSFALKINEDIFDGSATQGVFHLVAHYSCIPKTPLYHLLHERVKSHADAIKLTSVLNNIPSANANDFRQYTAELFKSMNSETILVDAFDNGILDSYCNDLVRTFCTIIENNFHVDRQQCQQTIAFVVRWLLLIDDDDRRSYDESSHPQLWLLAHVHTSFEYDRTDLLSMYSACRMIDRLDPTQSLSTRLFETPMTNRAELRETFFRLIFDHLWTDLRQVSLKKGDYQAWMQTYTFITKYYPSEKVLELIQLVEIKGQIDLMNLAYLVFLNDRTKEPQELVTRLLNGIRVSSGSDCLKSLPKIIEIIERHFQTHHIANSTLIIDLQQWVIFILKSLAQTSEQEILFLFKYLNQSSDHLSLAMKQFLFDQLIELYLQLTQKNNRKSDLWDHFTLIPILLECSADMEDLGNYRIPNHPSLAALDDQTKAPLLDLYFFYLRTQMNDAAVTYPLLNKGMLLKLPKTNKTDLIPLISNLFKQLKNYFLVMMLASLVCETDLNQNEKLDIFRILSTMISEILLVETGATGLSDYLQLFLSTIISKQSWHFLFEFLRSTSVQQLDASWANTLVRLLELNQTMPHNRHLQMFQQVQFTLAIHDTSSSAFPALHQPYEELRNLTSACVRNSSEEEPWQPLLDWIQTKSASLSANELKAMVLLNIYYDYYCADRLGSIESLGEELEIVLRLQPEERRVFRALMDPERSIIGYGDEDDESNALNNFFKLDCHDDFELSLRHLLVNLMAMIVLGGKQSFLWTMAFEPLKLSSTFGK